MFWNDRAVRAVDFIQALKHVKSPWTDKRFELLPWQYQVIADVYGTIKEDGLRQYQYCYLEVPKKNGKSELGAAIALLHTFADGEKYGEIYSCAADRQNASQVFDVAVAMIDMCPALKKRAKLTLSQHTITDKVSHSTYKAVSAEAYSKHGLNVSACIFDELHAQPNRDLWDVMTTYAGDAREQPLWFVITTAGDDPDRKSIGWEIHEKAEKIISGEVVDPRWYAKIWGVPHDFSGDIFDERLWFSVNPSLGTTIDIEKVRQAALSARNSEADERLFRWLRLNQWIAVKKIGWLPITLWDSTERDWSPADMLGERCYVGLDLSSTTDLTAAVCLFPPSDRHADWRHVTYAWIPEASMKERSAKDHVPYDKWVREKYLNATPGNVVDYGLVATELTAIEQRFKVVNYFSDPWRLEYLRQLLPDAIQSKFVEIPQTMAGMSCGMTEVERMMRTGELTHARDPLSRWSFGNVRVAVDGNSNQKPVKNKSIERIDPTVAMINAMSGAIKMEPRRSVYESRGLRTVG
jgi:phage terminase large subunit-like protein